tara:strand:+ start:89 stop:1003 length:915 start_codon:yes stop_codon:yes gene_type:complete
MSTLQTVEFNSKQIEQLNDLISKMKKQCLDTIDEDDFEGDLDSFDTLFDRVFKLDKLTVSDKPMITTKKSKKKTKDPNMPKKAITPYISWLWNPKPNIGMSSIKSNPQYQHIKTHSLYVSQAGKIWKSMTDEDKKPFIQSAENDKLRYQKEIIEYKQSISQHTPQDTMENEQDTMENEQDTIEITQDTMENEQDTIENEQDTIENKQDTIEIEQDTMENKQDTIEIEQDLEGYEKMNDMYYTSYTDTIGKNKYDTLNEVLELLQDNNEYGGILMDKNGKYTVRKGNTLKTIPHNRRPQTFWKKI